MGKIEISCLLVRRELTNYLENDLSVEVRQAIDEHISRCGGCKAIYDGVRNVLEIVGRDEVFSIPPRLGERLLSRVREIHS